MADILNTNVDIFNNKILGTKEIKNDNDHDMSKQMAGDKNEILKQYSEEIIDYVKVEIDPCEEGSNIVNCKICFEDFNDSDSLNEHFQLVHNYIENNEYVFDKNRMHELGKRKKTCIRGPYKTKRHFLHKYYNSSECKNDCSDQKPYLCTQCNKSYSFPSYLIAHRREHTGETPFQCKQCNKLFKRASHLKRHERIHIEFKPYSCTDCSKSFRQLGNLKSHVRIHSGEKPYSCGTCQRLFRYSNALKSHERRHSGEKPYFCKECNKSFTNIGSLRKHEARHSKVTESLTIFEETTLESLNIV